MKLDPCPMCDRPLKMPKVVHLGSTMDGMQTIRIECPCGTTCRVRAKGEYAGCIISFNPNRSIRVRIAT